MNDSELRRQELLRKTRKLYDEKREIPAVHPRYGNIYHDLYGKDSADNETEYSGGFWIRLVLGILVFICFVCMDQNGLHFADINSQKIIDKIQEDSDGETLINVWKKL